MRGIDFVYGRGSERASPNGRVIYDVRHLLPPASRHSLASILSRESNEIS